MNQLVRMLALVWIAGCVAIGGGIAQAEAPFFEEQALFVAGEGGYKSYRIPSIIVAADGSLLAFCEARKNGPADDGDIDLVMRRSTDQGKTWSEMRVIADDGENTIGNPCPVLDRTTGILWLPYCRNNDQVFVMSSPDHGATWTAPVEITSSVKLDSWDKWYATGPGHGIQLASGRLLIPCDHYDEEEKYSHIIYSDDHGATWKIGATLDPKTNECEAVECADGSVCLNMRSYRGNHCRAVAWSKDGGLTFSPAVDQPALVEPVCQASIVRLTDDKRFLKNRVLFSNPRSKKRENLAVRISYDECQSWTEGKVLHEGPSAYSNLAVTNEGTILCLYERGREKPYETITLARFDIEWLTDGADTLMPR
ncbi:MAG: exo-alpha-sialidase [Pirellulales bacterium]|nr:exo-alpha-sialidase [Pirellulales bacterium]